MTKNAPYNAFKNASKHTGLDAKIYEMEQKFEKLGWVGTPTEFSKIIEEEEPDLKAEAKKLLLLDYLTVYFNFKKDNPETNEIKLAMALGKKISEASTDALTNVANVRAFDQRLNFEINRLQNLASEDTNRQTDGGQIIMLDIDGFKPINDQFGHQAGDIALQKIAETLSNASDSTSFPARLGGDEFAILIPNKDPNALENLEKAMNNLTFDYEGKRIKIRTSIACAMIDSTKTAADNKDMADKAMYAVKKGKGDTRNTITFSDIPKLSAVHPDLCA